jgi:RPA family protein
MVEQMKREIAHKLRIGDILKGNAIIEKKESDISSGGVQERFNFLELEDKQIKRVNIVANIIDKFISEGEKKWGSITIDDASGQLKVKVFGDDIIKFQELSQGDTLLVIGMLRSYNNELYILPEIIKKTDPRYLLVRKLEIEGSSPKQETTAQNTSDSSSTDVKSLREQIIDIIKAGEDEGGVDTEQLIIKLKDSTPDSINQEITKLLEDGTIYEPRPGRVRYLG